jgi:hypothetical protein
MADNNTPVTVRSDDAKAASEALNNQEKATKAAADAALKHKEAIEESSSVFKNHTDIISITNNVFDKFNSKLNISATNLRNLSDPTSNLTSQFGLLTTGILGAEKSFSNLGFDSKNINNFSDQLGGIIGILQNPSSFSKTAIDEAKGAIVRLLEASGASGDSLKKAISEGPGALIGLAKNILETADNGLRMQNVFLKLSGVTGNFGDVIASAGQDLSNMNKLLAQQTTFIKDANKDTNLGTQALTEYWSILGKIPNILNEMNVSLPGSSKSLNILSASIQMATGSGRDYKELLGDLEKSTIEFGLSTSQAFSFVAKISDLSSQLKAPLADIKKNLMETATSFTKFADTGEAAAKQSAGIAEIMNRYGQALKNTGMTAQASVSLVSNMTKSITELSIAQKSFLSQQSGGPGGLRGAFNIENMLRKGETEKVFEMVRSQMKKQFGGNIVSLEDASKSEASATQLQKQMLMLQQGPLAKLAKNDQEAYRILEAFKDMDKGKAIPKELSKNLAVEQIDRGKKVQELSKTSFGDLKSTLENTMFTANIANLDTMQKMFTGRVGSINTNDTNAQKQMRQIAASTTTETNKDSSISKSAADDLDKIRNTPKVLRNTFDAFIDGSKKVLGIKDTTEQKQRQELKQSIENAKSTPKQVKPEFKTSDFSSLREDNFGETSAPQIVRAAVKSNSEAETIAQPSKKQEPLKTRIDNAIEDFNFKVNVEAVCSHCKHSLEISEQEQSVRPSGNR